MNMTAYNKGRLQSSFWIVDKQHVYIGSAGLDWQSLGQVIFSLHKVSVLSASKLPPPKKKTNTTKKPTTSIKHSVTSTVVEGN